MLRSLVEKLLPAERSWQFARAQARPRDEVIAQLAAELRGAGAAEVEVGRDQVVRFHTGLLRLAGAGNPLNGVTAGELRVMENNTHLIVASRIEFRGWVIAAFLLVNFCVWIATGVIGCIALPMGLVVGAVGCGLLLVMIGVMRGQGIAGLVRRAAIR